MSARAAAIYKARGFVLDQDMKVFWGRETRLLLAPPWGTLWMTDAAPTVEHVDLRCNVNEQVWAPTGFFNWPAVRAAHREAREPLRLLCDRWLAATLALGFNYVLDATNALDDYGLGDPQVLALVYLLLAHDRSIDEDLVAIVKRTEIRPERLAVVADELQAQGAEQGLWLATMLAAPHDSHCALDWLGFRPKIQAALETNVVAHEQAVKAMRRSQLATGLAVDLSGPLPRMLAMPLRNGKSLHLASLLTGYGGVTQSTRMLGNPWPRGSLAGASFDLVIHDDIANVGPDISDQYEPTATVEPIKYGRIFYGRHQVNP